MPNHIHLLIWPNSEALISDFMRDFKSFTSKRIIRQAKVEKRTEWLTHFSDSGIETSRSANKVWQDSYWEMNIFSQKFVHQKLNYIHANPLRANLVEEPAEFPYSSYRNYVRDENWLIEIDRGWR